MKTFQDIVLTLKEFWKSQGVLLVEGYDLEVGACTFHPETFFSALGQKPYSMCCAQPCRRPTDGRYGENPNRLQRYYQFQVIIKPSPVDIQKKYLESLASLGLDIYRHDVRFVHDDWKSPSLGAWGLGWEVWLDGMEVSQFTYFQQVGGVELKPITVELTYGLERIAMYLQGVDNVYEVYYDDKRRYGEIFRENERQFSAYNFEFADVEGLKKIYQFYYEECKNCLKKGLVLPAYDQLIKCSHLFNLLDARSAVSATSRALYIQDMRLLSVDIAASYARLQEGKEAASSHV